MDLGARQLSDREHTVLLLAAEGLTDKEIAKHLNLSQRTIGTYWERMREKLGHYSRTQLVARLVRYDNEVSGRDGYRSLFASWEEGVWIVSPAGKTLYANHRIAELFDLTADQLEQVDARVLLERSTSSSLEKIFQSSDDQGTKIEFRIEKHGMPPIWIEMQASGVVSSRTPNNAVLLRLADVTIRKRVRHTLEWCENSVNFLAEHSTGLVARFDSDLVCTMVNKSFGRNLPEAGVVGKKIHDCAAVFKPLDEWVSYVKAALSSGETQTFRSKLGGMTHVLPLPSESERPSSVLTVTTIGEDL